MHLECFQSWACKSKVRSCAMCKTRYGLWHLPKNEQPRPIARFDTHKLLLICQLFLVLEAIVLIDIELTQAVLNLLYYKSVDVLCDSVESPGCDFLMTILWLSIYLFLCYICVPPFLIVEEG